MAKQILLDTHIWLWLNASPQRLSKTARELIQNPDNRLLLSVASIWEISIKTAAGKLELPQTPERYIIQRLTANAVDILPILAPHAIRAAALPMHHRDPFDRMLIAQAQIEGLELMTQDEAFALYEVATIKD